MGHQELHEVVLGPLVAYLLCGRYRWCSCELVDGRWVHRHLPAHHTVFGVSANWQAANAPPQSHSEQTFDLEGVASDEADGQRNMAAALRLGARDQLRPRLTWPTVTRRSAGRLAKYRAKSMIRRASLYFTASSSFCQRTSTCPRSGTFRIT